MSRLLLALSLAIATLRGAVLGQGAVRDIAFSPDGERVAVARTTQVEIWDSTLHHLISTIPQKGNGLAWSPDGAKLAVQGVWTTLWDVPAGSKLTEWPSNNRAASISWSPSGERLVEAGNGSTLVYGVDGKLRTSQPKARLFEVAWSGVGNRVATLVDSGAEIWDPDSGKLIRTIAFNPGTFIATQNRFADLAWSPREPLLATCDAGNTIQIWNVDTGDLLATIKAGGTMHSQLSWSRDGERVALATDQSLIVWEGHSGKLVREIQSASRITLATFSPLLDHAIATNGAGQFEVWDLASNRSERVSSQRVESEYLAWSPQDLLLASWGSSGVVQIWDHSKGLVRSEFQAAIWGDRSVVWSSDGHWVAAASADGSISLHDVLVGNVTLTLRGARAPVFAISQSPDQTHLAAVAGGSLCVWDLSKPGPPLQFPIAGMQLAWSSAGTILVATMDNSLVEIDAATGKPTWSPTLETPPGRQQAPPVWISADGRAFIAGPRRTLWVRDSLSEAHEVGALPNGPETGFSWTADSGSVYWAQQMGAPGSLYTYDLRSGGKTSWMNLPLVPGHKSVAVSTDRRALAVGAPGIIMIVPGPRGR